MSYLARGHTRSVGIDRQAIAAGRRIEPELRLRVAAA